MRQSELRQVWISEFIGPIRKVKDKEALHYARAFYRHLFKKTILTRIIKPAQSLLAAKQEMLQEKPNCITPLLYRLYGDPKYIIKRKSLNWIEWIKHWHNSLIVLICILVITGIITSKNAIEEYGIQFLPGFTSLVLSDYIKKSVALHGELEWSRLIRKYKNDNIIVEEKSAEHITKHFASYKSKYMIFPEISDSLKFTDDLKNNYYYYREPNTTNVFLLRYDQSINKKFIKYLTLVGNLDCHCYFLGQVTDAFQKETDEINKTQHFNLPDTIHVVIMDIVAVWAKGRALVYIDNDTPVLVGESIIEKKKNKL